MPDAIVVARYLIQMLAPERMFYSQVNYSVFRPPGDAAAVAAPVKYIILKGCDDCLLQVPAHH